jgi:predicted nucleic acid-binding protein
VTRWVLDTNVYVRASRDGETRRALNAFHDRHFARTDVAATVWLELQIGARSRTEQADLDALVRPFTILTPSARAFQQAGRVLAALHKRERLDPATVRASFHYDVLLACTVREHRRTLITYNAGDFTRIQRHLKGFRFTDPFP